MSNELSFLLDLLLNHKLPKVTKDAVALRLKEIGDGMQAIAPLRIANPAVASQAPSTQAIMARNPDLIPVEAVAQTPAAQAAMASRNQAIAESMAGKVDKTTGRPRKF